jgi:hypothetical protein
MGNVVAESASKIKPGSTGRCCFRWLKCDPEWRHWRAMCPPLPEQKRAASILESRICLALFAATVLWLALVLGSEINRPWINGADYNGAVWSQAAHNTLRAGLIETAGASSGFYFGPLPIPPWGYYLHHPPLLHLAIAALFSLFGEHEWVARLVPIACSLASLIFFWLLVRSCGGQRLAALASVVFACLPMQIRYGAMVNFEPCVLMLMLGALLCLRWNSLTGRSGWKYGALAFVIVGLWVDWAMHLFVIAICGCWFLRRKSGDRRFGIVLLLTAFLSAAIYVLRISELRPDAWQNLYHTFMFRLGTGQGRHFTAVQWTARITDTIVSHFLLIGLLVAAVGAWLLWKSRDGEEGTRWLGRAALSIFVMDALFVGVFQNDSYIHQYLAFYFLAPVSIAVGVALDRLVGQLAKTKFAFRGAAEGAVCLGLIAFSIFSFDRADALVRQFRILDYRTEEPPGLIPELGRAIRSHFSSETHVLCNFLPDYGPQLAYYAQRDILNNLTEFNFWRPYLNDKSRRIGGVVWISASPAAQTIVAQLPPGPKQFLTVGNQEFCLWNRGDAPQVH